MKKTFRTALLLSLGLLLSPALQAQTAVAPPSSVNTQKMNQFVADLMQKMTLEEKIGQLNLVSVGFDVTGPVVSKDVDANIRKGNVGAVLNTYTPVAARKLQELAVKESRLKIPLILGYDVIHGHRTILPIPLGMAASWDMPAMERGARIAAEEAAADGINWVYSPMVDIARDPRWGRIAEGAGEDPYLGAQIARAMVRGYQGPDNDMSKPANVMACLKHFALYGAAEAGRDYNTTDMSLVRMYNEYLPPYKAAIEAGVGSVMTSFNDINGIPATGNKWLMTDLLRTQWGFNGFVATDYTAINEMTAHGMGNDAQVSALALNAGTDQDMVGEIFLKNLALNLKAGTVKQEQIDLACRRVLEAKYKLGLFQDPYRGVTEKRAKATMMKKEFIADARSISRKSLVLLKNDKNTLPLKKTGTIALIGPLANRQRDMIGSWSGAGDWKQAVSLEQGIKNVAGNGVKIVYAQGANITDDQQMIERLNAHGGELNIDKRTPEAMIQEAVQAAQNADVIVAAVGESQGMTGEAASRADITLPGQQLELLKALKKTGKPLVLVLMNGRPMALSWENQNADAILETWFSGTQGGNAIADVLFGDYNPSGKITATFPQVVGQVPLYYNHKSTGRPFNGTDKLDKYKSRYLDVSNEPLYPFGYGLSYTTFSYGKPELSKTTIKQNESLEVRVTVRNTGNVDGEETAQLYIRDMVGSISRPVKELKGFQKVALKKGESKTLTFRLTPDDLKFYNNELRFVSEPGDFQVFVGTNSRDVHEAAFKME
ncbi:glycoside hydrolase family 3 domain protein [Hymenobacter roseosalivarius DSM 11622]|uniref:Periplasmic beta-glucosidase n=1 Tax=Hymenobacter roseosalivarius DSM 11622 TaxID=645990 RepID=A0A1W1VY60_9BACT|nr:beta-glucosidase BglX [Hymenobacter roseosalivarius]SMB98307.1 glycoside hydrolase family 3 domain protein [Hymenobacter roseosalivarius DSM 11622]